MGIGGASSQKSPLNSNFQIILKSSRQLYSASDMFVLFYRSHLQPMLSDVLGNRLPEYTLTLGSVEASYTQGRAGFKWGNTRVISVFYGILENELETIILSCIYTYT